MRWTRLLRRLGWKAARPEPRPSSYRPRLEWLEDRTAPATLTVTTNADSVSAPPSGSLRATLASANNGDTINFAPSLAGQTIALGTPGVFSQFSNSLTVNKSVTITGQGVPGIIITTNSSGPAFTTTGGVSATIDSLTISKCAVSQIGPGSVNGGGISNNGSTLTVSNCTFSGNQAAGNGGAIVNGGTLTVINSTFTSNSANGGAFPMNAAGGAIDSTGTLTIINSTIVGNSVTGSGGGLAIGGGSATVENTIIANNNAAVSSADVSGTISIALNDLFSTSPTIAAGGGNLLNTNPQLSSAGLQNNGGLTQTIAELPGSPAIGAGSPNFVTSPPFSGPPFFDQRGFGFPRFSFNGTVDIGAFQFQTTNNYYATGTDAGISTAITIYNSAGTAIGSFNPFAGTGFAGGVRVAVGDVSGDGIPDLIVGSGRGGIGVVLVYDGKSVLTNPNNPTLFRSFNPYSNVFTGGVFVAAGNFDGGPVDEIVTGADGGGGPQVNIYSAAQIQAGNLAIPAVSFFAYASTFTGGVRVAAGDVNGDGLSDLITAAGPGGGPQINIYPGTSGGGFLQGYSMFGLPFASLTFFAFGPNVSSFTGGIFVTAEDVNGDGKADLFFGAGANSTEVTLFSGAQLFAPAANTNPLTAFFAISPGSFTGGVRVGTTIGQLSSGQTGPVFLASAGPGGGPQVAEFDAASIFNNPSTAPTPFLSFNVPIGLFSNGVFVSVT